MNTVTSPPRVDNGRGARAWLTVAQALTAGYIGLGLAVAIVIGTRTGTEVQYNDYGPGVWHDVTVHPFIGVAIAIAVVVVLTGGVVFALISASRARTR